MIKIYFDNSQLVISSYNYKIDKNFVLVKQNDDISNIIFNFLNKKPLFNNIYLCADNADELFAKLSKYFVNIDAAGGLVKNCNNDYLFIYRNNKWDLPKGKVENNESIENAAKREVIEECGLNDVKIVSFLTKTYHIYKLNNNYCLKHNYWYNMNIEDNPVLKPQIEENISIVEWVSVNDLNKIILNTYPSIKDVVLKGGLCV